MSRGYTPRHAQTTGDLSDEWAGSDRSDLAMSALNTAMNGWAQTGQT